MQILAATSSREEKQSYFSSLESNSLFLERYIKMLKTRADVRWQEQNEGEYLIHYNQDVFEANDVVVRILELCHNSLTPDALIHLLLREYDIDPETLTSDLIYVISELKKANILVEVEDEQ